MNLLIHTNDVIRILQYFAQMVWWWFNIIHRWQSTKNRAAAEVKWCIKYSSASKIDQLTRKIDKRLMWYCQEIKKLKFANIVAWIECQIPDWVSQTYRVTPDNYLSCTYLYNIYIYICICICIYIYVCVCVWDLFYLLSWSPSHVQRLASSHLTILYLHPKWLDLEAKSLGEVPSDLCCWFNIAFCIFVNQYLWHFMVCPYKLCEVCSIVHNNRLRFRSLWPQQHGQPKLQCPRVAVVLHSVTSKLVYIYIYIYVYL